MVVRGDEGRELSCGAQKMTTWVNVGAAILAIYSVSLPGPMWLSVIGAVAAVLNIFAAYVNFCTNDIERDIDAALKRIMEEDPCHWLSHETKAAHSVADK